MRTHLRDQLRVLRQMASAVAAAIDPAIQLDDEQLAHASDRNSTFLRAPQTLHPRPHSLHPKESASQDHHLGRSSGEFKDCIP